MEVENSRHAEEEDASHGLTTDEKVTLASINGVPKFNTFKMRGVLQGHKVLVLIDGGASHNFIESVLLQRRHIPTIEFEEFRVEVAGGRTMPCDRYIPGMKLTLGRHDLAHDFYVMELPDTKSSLECSGLVHWGQSPQIKKPWKFLSQKKMGKRWFSGV
jgi:hypothetical protein